MDRRELAVFLRSRRARLHPGDVGLTGGPRRRTPGLRRAEVATLAGMSVEYYIRLEQARAPWPSQQILAALSRALRLSGDERAYLFDLAGRTARPAGPRQDVPIGIRQLLDRLEGIAAVVIDPKQDVLAWNAMAAALITDFAARPPRERNLFRGVFLDPATRTRLDPHRLREFARTAVADLRAAAARYPRDPEIGALVAELTAASGDFAELWSGHEVQVRGHFTKRMRHPVVGELELDCETLLVPDRDQRLVLYTAQPATASAAALRALQAFR